MNWRSLIESVIWALALCFCVFQLRQCEVDQHQIDVDSIYPKSSSYPKNNWGRCQ